MTAIVPRVQEQGPTGPGRRPGCPAKDVVGDTMPKAEQRRARVLVVDDDPAAVVLLARYLREAGHEVLTAENGVAALNILQAEGPPMIIADWMMPGMDGLKLCRAVREHEGISFAYVIIVTAHSNDNGLIQAFDAGADDYLTKPFKRRELMARVRAGERIIHLQADLGRRNREVHRINAEMEITHRKLAEANATLNRMASTDELTGLINRRAALSRLADYWVAADRHTQSLACVAVDIDHFKDFNDVYGHEVGDLVLQETARVLRRTARREEPVCRMGGEEFLMLCPLSTETMAAVGAERLRTATESSVVQCGDLELRVTISLGIAERTPAMSGPDDLLRAADDALYAAKDSGRNRVCLASVVKNAAVTESLSRALNDDGARSDTKCAADQNARILVADDDASARTLCGRFLERAGYQVTQAVDGVDALEKVNRDPPDVIILDTAMPGLSGLECTRALKGNSATQNIPVVMIAGRTDGTGVEMCLEAGVDEYLNKPLHGQELLVRIRSMLRLRQRGSGSPIGGAVPADQSHALTHLLDFARDSALAPDLPTVLDRTISTTAELTHCRRVAIMFPDADHGRLRVARSIGLEAEVARGICVPPGGRTSGWVFASGDAVLVNRSEGMAPRGHEYDSDFFVSTPLMSTPLRTGEHIVGVLNLSGRHRGTPFEPHEVEYVSLICRTAAAAIYEHLAGRPQPSPTLPRTGVFTGACG